MTPPAGARVAPAATDARLEGRVVTTAGAPVADAEGAIVQSDTSLFSSGPSRPIARLTTAGDGAYTGTLPRAYVAGTETDADWIVTATRPAQGGQATGPSSSFEFEVNNAVQAAPDVPLWESVPRVEVNGYEAQISVDGQPTGLTPYVVAGSTTQRGPSGRFDLRAFEPGTGDARNGDRLTAGGRTYANITVRHSTGRTIYHQTINTPTVAIAEPPLVPPSRGAACSVTATDGRVTSPKLCRLTDGDLTTRVGPTGSPATSTPSTTAVGVSSVTVTLPTPVDVESVFLRECSGGCVVEVSSDGATWARSRTVESLSISSGLITVARFEPVASAQAVRVSSSRGAITLAEISAWPARPPGSPAPPTPAPPTPSNRSTAHAAAPGAADRPRRAIGPPVAALLLVGAVGVGVLVVGLTRRKG